MAKYIDENGLAHFWDTISDRINDVQGQLYSREKGLYIGRIAPESTTKAYPQGMCLLDDSTGLFTMTSANSNEADVFKVDLVNKVVLEKFTGNFAHANSLCYDSTRDVVYVCPSYDYSSGSTRVNYFYECDPDTLQITATRTFTNIHPESIAIDPATGTYYITGRESTGLHLYSFDISTLSLTYIGSVSNMVAQIQYESSALQTVRAYDGLFYCVLGGRHCQAIVVFDSSMTIKNIIGLSDSLFIYNMYELQDIDFTSHGDVVFYATVSSPIFPSRFGGIGGINVHGNMLGWFDYPQHDEKAIHVKSDTANYAIDQNGTSAKPFTDFIEALQAVNTGRGECILLDGDFTVPEKSTLEYMRIIVLLNNHILTFSAGMTFNFCNMLFYKGTLNTGSTTSPVLLDYCDAIFASVTVDGTSTQQNYPLRCNHSKVLLNGFNITNRNNARNMVVSQSMVIQDASTDPIVQDDAAFYNRA